jgi:glyoxylase-like metal-dependent hydrolase (beta-lactamase superfamily II)
VNDGWSPHLIDTIELDPWTAHAVADARFMADGGVAFSMVPRSLWERETRVTGANAIPLRIGVLLLERPGVRLVVDAGLGDSEVPRAVRGFFGGLTARGGLGRALDELGWEPDSITHLVLTHLHVDHAGGAFDASGRLVFPRAKVLAARRELEYALNPHPLRGPVYDVRAARLLAQCGNLTLVDTLPVDVTPGVEVTPLGGHTPGLLGLSLQARDRVLFAPGDLIPTRAHRRARWVLSYDQDPSRVYEERRRHGARAMARGWIVHFCHDPEVAFGYLRAGGGVEPVPARGRGTAGD